jgi:hypothetical protein
MIELAQPPAIIKPAPFIAKAPHVWRPTLNDMVVLGILPGMMGAVAGFGNPIEAQLITWNPSDSGAGITLSNGNLDLVSNGSFYAVRATLSRSTGKFHYEQTLVAASTSNLIFGWMDSGASLSNFVGNSAKGFGVNSTTTMTYNTGYTTSNAWSLAAPVQGDVVMFEIDYDAGKAWAGKNGTWSASGDPAAGTNPWVTFTASAALFPAGSSFDASHKLRANFGATAFAYTPSAGFSAYNVA